MASRDITDKERDLLSAAREGNLELAISVLHTWKEDGTNVNCRGKLFGSGGLTPLQLSSFFGHARVVEVLLAKGADPNMQDEHGDTPLHRAALTGRKEIVMLLLKYMADVTIRNGSGQTPRQLTRDEEIRRLLQGAEDTQRLDMEQKFLTAARDGSVSELLGILNGLSPPNINCRDVSGNTALHCAANRGHKEVVILLLQHGIDTAILNNQRKAAIDLAKDEQTKDLLHVSPVSARLRLEASRLEGPLSKSSFRGWKIRWFVLDNCVLSYYNSAAEARSGDGRVLDSIHLSTATVSDAESDPTLIRIRGNSVNYQLRAESADERAKWVLAMKNQQTYFTMITLPGDTISVAHSGKGTSSSTTASMVKHQRGGPSTTAGTVTAATPGSLTLPNQTSVDQSESLDADILPRLGTLSDSLANAVRDREVLEKQLSNVEQLIDAAASVIASAADAAQQGQSSVDASATAASKVLELADDVVRSLTQSRDTSRVLWRTLSHCLSILAHHEHIWSKRFELEKERRRVLEEGLRVLAAEHDQLERSVISISSRKSSHVDLTDENFFDATDADFQYRPPLPGANRNGGSNIIINSNSSSSRRSNNEDGDDDDDDDTVSVYDDALTDASQLSPGNAMATGSTLSSKRSGSSVLSQTAPSGSIPRQSSTDSTALLLTAGSFANALPTSRTSVVNGKRVHRSSLAQPMVDRKNLSVWAFLKQCIGKDLSKITMPVLFNEPVSFLQRLCEDLEYAMLLDKGTQSSNPLVRIQYVMAFAVSGYAATANRLGKPFNPLLGETFELERDLEEGSVMRALCEQVSHHPPISALVCESPHFVFHEFNDVRIKFWGKSIEIVPAGNMHLRLKVGETPEGDENYTWSKVTTCVHNIIVGKMWIDQYGTMEVINHTTGDKCIMNFKPRSWFSAPNAACELEGFVVSAATGKKTHLLGGRWNECLYSLDVSELASSGSGASSGSSSSSSSSSSSAAGPTIALDTLRNHPKAVRLWERNPLPANSAQMYNMTTFAMTLNEIDDELARSVAPTDSRLRPDQRALENGDVDLATKEKVRLEDKQRLARKVRAREGKEHASLWFEEKDGGYNGKKGWLYKGGYWEARERGQFDNCPDIF